MTIKVRKADPLDTRAIARVHVIACHESYRGIVTERALAGIGIADREAHWEAAVRDLSRTVFVAEIHGEIAGFAAARPADDAVLGTRAEITDIYVLKRWQCRGVGTRLMGALASRLRGEGVPSLGMWLSRDNIAAIAFSRALGGELGATRTHATFGSATREVALVWDDIGTLAFWDDEEMHGKPVLSDRVALAAQVV